MNLKFKSTAEIKVSKRIVDQVIGQDEAVEAINKLVKAGIRAILNFAPVRPQAAKGVEILNIDLAIELEKLAYFLS